MVYCIPTPALVCVQAGLSVCVHLLCGTVQVLYLFKVYASAYVAVYFFRGEAEHELTRLTS